VLYFLVAFHSDYEQLWAIPQDQQQAAAAEAVANFESAPLPIYSDQLTVPPPPPPPYTTHASIGEISIHRSYHNEPSLDHEAAVILDGNQLQHFTQPGEVDTVYNTEHENAVSSCALTCENGVQSQNIHHPNDTEQVTEQTVLPPPLSWLPAPMPPHEQFNVQSDQMAVPNHPIATSTPTPSLSELNSIPNTTDISIRNGLQPAAPPAVSPSPPKCGVPLLRPIRPKNFSAPNLFVSYPSPPPPDSNDILNNTMPRMSRLPPLRRKTAPNLPEISHQLFNEDQMLKLQSLPQSMSAFEAIREVNSCEISTEPRSLNNS